jgi:FtsH-binding integral membrane protein
MSQPVRKTEWSPVIALMVIAPSLGELLCGSSPPVEFFSIIGLPFQILLYGAGAVLCREVARRWGKGWPALLLLGAAYGVFEEGFVCSSFYNIGHPDLGPMKGWDRWLGTNWVWSLDLTVYHAILSIGISVLVAEAFFPARARQPWLGPRALPVLAVLFFLNGLAMHLLFGLFFIHFWPSPAHYAATFLLMLGFVWLARRVPYPLIPQEDWTARKAHPILFGILGLAGYAAFLLHLAWPASAGLHPVAAFFLMLAIVIGATSVLYVITRRYGPLPARSRLALGSGILAGMSLLALAQENDPNRTDNTAGMALVGLAGLFLVVWLNVRAWRHGKQDQTVVQKTAEV